MATQNAKGKAGRPKAKKISVLRHAEYYEMQETYDKLYAQSKKDVAFDGLMDIILRRENILLAYRNIKGNTGSVTPGTDGLTMRDIGKLSQEEMVEKVQTILRNYTPRAVRRKEIPKPGGKIRPLGIPCIWDRLIQQCILQVLEPICEAKFSDNSHGFRPNRSCKNAIGQAHRLMQLSKLHHVVEVDIKGFFDNVDHSKLLKQIWALGIRDKHLLYIIRRILTAPIRMPDGTATLPEKGTPQGGILSPLLANIVLNELDRWVESQWQKHPITEKYPVGVNRNGSLNRGTGYAAMKKTNLKEMFIVRYADDFRIFCRTRNAALRTMVGVTQWLEQRLHLQVSSEKTRVVNLKRQYMEFLGIKLKVRKKGNKYVARSHVGDKAIKRIGDRAVELISAIARPKDNKDENRAIYAYNAFVMGEHNYYQMATSCCFDFKKIAYRVNKVLKNRLGPRLRRMADLRVIDAVAQKYGRSDQIRFVSNHPIAPIGYVRCVKPTEKKRSINKYTPEGREEIHKNLRINTAMLVALMKQHAYGRSVEFMDNRISLYCAQYGKCAITHREFESAADIHCHHKVPVSEGGMDNYQNLVLVSPDAHRLIHATDRKTIDKYLHRLGLSLDTLDRLNWLRKLVGNTGIYHLC